MADLASPMRPLLYAFCRGEGETWHRVDRIATGRCAAREEDMVEFAQHAPGWMPDVACASCFKATVETICCAERAAVLYGRGSHPHRVMLNSQHSQLQHQTERAAALRERVGELAVRVRRLRRQNLALAASCILLIVTSLLARCS